MIFEPLAPLDGRPMSLVTDAADSPFAKSSFNAALSSATFWTSLMSSFTVNSKVLYS
ncbi:hypothetical protein D3C73_1583720 [compost metagenome]